MEIFNAWNAFLACLLGLFAACVCQITYRLMFHPLATFPGPKLTAATHLVQIYYDLFHKGGGQFPYAYREWHKKYGPIIRITPDELHINDAFFYEYFYSPTRPVRKWKDFGYRFNVEHTEFGAIDPELYRIRRNALNPFFSRRKAVEYAPIIQQKIEKLVARLKPEYVGSGKILNVTKMWECYAADNAAHFAFDRSYGFLDAPEFHSKVNEGIAKLTELSHWMQHIPLLVMAVRSIPMWLMAKLSPDTEPLLKYWNAIDEQVGHVLCAYNTKQDIHDNSLMRSLLDQDQEKYDMTPIRLEQEAKGVVGAGSETVSRAMTVATFHILNQPETKERLVAELREAIPDPNVMPDYDTLSQLPYLSACVEETLRLTYGVAERRARAYDGGPLVYGDWTIPTGTMVSMDNFDVARDERIFPDSGSFRPERWLNNPKAPDGKQLSRYMVSFGKGTRNCIGIWVAYAELFVGMAGFFRSSFVEEMKLVDCGLRDVEMAREVFVPRPFEESQGVKAVFTKYS